MAAQITGFAATEAIGKDLVATYIREDQVRFCAIVFGPHFQIRGALFGVDALP